MLCSIAQGFRFLYFAFWCYPRRLRTTTLARKLRHPPMVNSSAWPSSGVRKSAWTEEEDNLLTGLRKGAWTEEEDNLLRKCIQKYGEGKWHLVPLRAGLNRCRKSCRLRWLNYLRPDIKRGDFSADEDDLILRLHKLIGNKWSLIAGRIPGRTANDVKNYWNTHLQKKVFAMATSRQDNWKGKAPEIRENTVVVRPRPWRFLKTFSSRTSMTEKTTAVANDVQLQRYTTPLPESTSHLLMENIQQNNSITTLPPEAMSHDGVQWGKDLLADEEFNDEGIACNHEGQIGYYDFSTDMDLWDLFR